MITEDRATGESFFSRFSLAKLGERGTDNKMKQRGRDRKQTISIGSKLDTFAEQDKPHDRGENQFEYVIKGRCLAIFSRAWHLRVRHTFWYPLNRTNFWKILLRTEQDCVAVDVLRQYYTTKEIIQLTRQWHRQEFRLEWSLDFGLNNRLSPGIRPSYTGKAHNFRCFEWMLNIALAQYCLWVP